MTPLHWACEHNHIDIAKILLQAGARHDIKSKVSAGLKIAPVAGTFLTEALTFATKTL